MAGGYAYVENLLDRMEVPKEGILSLTVHDDDRVRVVLFGFAEGEKLTKHTASQPAILHFLKGEALLTLGDEAMEAREGGWVHMPAELPHSIQARTPVAMLLLLIKGIPPGGGTDRPHE